MFASIEHKIIDKINNGEKSRKILEVLIGYFTYMTHCYLIKRISQFSKLISKLISNIV